MTRPWWASRALAEIAGTSITSNGPWPSANRSISRVWRSQRFQALAPGGSGSGDQACASCPRARRASARLRATCAAPSSADRGGWLTTRILTREVSPAHHHVPHHQPVHAGAQETVERLGGGVDDRLVLVER